MFQSRSMRPSLNSRSPIFLAGPAAPAATGGLQPAASAAIGSNSTALTPPGASITRRTIAAETAALQCTGNVVHIHITRVRTRSHCDIHHELSLTFDVELRLVR